MSCELCGAPQADMYNEQGQQVCRRCHAHKTVEKIDREMPGLYIKLGIAAIVGGSVILLIGSLLAFEAATSIHSSRGTGTGGVIAVVGGGAIAEGVRRLREGLRRRRKLQGRG